MGDTAAETLREIEATRARLEADLDTLIGRLPEPAALARKAKTYGLAAAGGVAALGLIALQARGRADERARRTSARINAEELARAFASTGPVEPAARRRTGRLAAVIAVGAAVAVAGRLRGRG